MFRPSKFCKQPLVEKIFKSYFYYRSTNSGAKIRDEDVDMQKVPNMFAYWIHRSIAFS